MSRGPLLLWLVMEFGWLHLVPVTSEITVRSFLGQSVTLPCSYLSWSQNSNSMCWGKGQCPKSKCSQELLHTDGTSVISSMSAKYSLRGNIRRGDLSLTISNTKEEDSGVYCCRIEVPGWFNDVKNNIRLVLSRAPTTTRRTTTSKPATTPPTMTAMAGLPTTAVTTPAHTPGTPLQITATSVFTTATTCPLTALTSLPEVDTSLLTTGSSTEGPVPTTESITFGGSSASWLSPEATSADTASATVEEGPETWVPSSSTSQVTWKASDSGETGDPVTSPQTASETTNPAQSKSNKNHKTSLVVIIASCLGFVLLALVVTFVLRGKVTKTNCLQKHKRLDNLGESKSALSDMPHGQDEDEGLFTL